MLNREAKRRNGGLGMNFKGCKELGVVLAALALTVNYSP